MGRGYDTIYNATYAATPTITAMSAGAALESVGRPAEVLLDEAAAAEPDPEAETAAMLAAAPEMVAFAEADADVEED